MGIRVRMMIFSVSRQRMSQSHYSVTDEAPYRVIKMGIGEAEEDEFYMQLKMGCRLMLCHENAQNYVSVFATLFSWCLCLLNVCISPSRCTLFVFYKSTWKLSIGYMRILHFHYLYFSCSFFCVKSCVLCSSDSCLIFIKPPGPDSPIYTRSQGMFECSEWQLNLIISHVYMACFLHSMAQLASFILLMTLVYTEHYIKSLMSMQNKHSQPCSVSL